MVHLIVTNDEEVVRFAKARGADIFTPQGAVERVEPNGGKEKKFESSKVYFILRELDIRPNIKGYLYIKFLMEQCQADPSYHNASMTKEIYPDCAKQFDTTPSRVERAMRHALELSFQKVPESYSELFGGTFTKVPTNSEFIGLVAEYFAKNN